MRVWWTVAVAILLASSVWAASKPHVVVLGKWTTAKLQADDDNSAIDVKVRPLFVDGKTKEFHAWGRTRNYRAHFRRAENVSPQRYPASGIRSSPLALGKGG